jgi:hypothetical protein
VATTPLRVAATTTTTTTAAPTTAPTTAPAATTLVRLPAAPTHGALGDGGEDLAIVIELDAEDLPTLLADLGEVGGGKIVEDSVLPTRHGFPSWIGAMAPT